MQFLLLVLTTTQVDLQELFSWVSFHWKASLFRLEIESLLWRKIYDKISTFEGRSKLRKEWCAIIFVWYIYCYAVYKDYSVMMDCS